MKQLTLQFGNCFRRADPDTVETWLQSDASCWNQLI